MILFYILISTLIVSLISLAGVITLFFESESINKILLILVAFSAGALIGGAFLHLIPEAIENAGSENLISVFIWIIIGFCAFFVLEKFIHWHHHHALDHPDIEPFSYLILFSDTLHNFIDGLVIAASFLVAPQIGVATVIAVAMHEIPQELGDFGVLVYGGMKKGKALLLNFVSAIFAILGGLLGFFLFERMGGLVIYLLPFTAGNFIYIASSDLIPEIKHEDNTKKSIITFLFFLAGIALMLFFKN
jgi:zinc and cadmium transporter